VTVHNAPVSKGYVIRNTRAPKLLSSGDGLVVKHRELWTMPAQAVTNAFESANASINPALGSGTGADASPFTWLASIGAKYARYKIRKMEFTYVPAVSTATSGSVGLYMLYNAAEDPSTNIESSMAHYRAISGPIWKQHKLNAVAANAASQPINGRLTRDSAVTYAVDRPDYDFGRIVVFHTSPTVGTLGQVWVDYEIELFAPVA
jgi:hypothetical protein